MYERDRNGCVVFGMPSTLSAKRRAADIRWEKKQRGNYGGKCIGGLKVYIRRSE